MAGKAKEERHIEPELIRFAIVYALYELEQFQAYAAKDSHLEIANYRLKYLEDIMRAERSYSKNYDEDLAYEVKLRNAVKKPLIKIYEKVRDDSKFTYGMQLEAISALIAPWCESKAALTQATQKMALKRHEVSGEGASKWASIKLREVFELRDDRTLEKFDKGSTMPINLNGIGEVLKIFFSDEAVTQALEILEQDRAEEES